MTPEWGDGAVHVPVRGWGNVLAGISWNSAKANAESCTWDGTTSPTNAAEHDYLGNSLAGNVFRVLAGCSGLCGVSLLRVTQKTYGHSPGQQALGVPAWAGGVGPDDCQRSLPTSTILCRKEEDIQCYGICLPKSSFPWNGYVPACWWEVVNGFLTLLCLCVQVCFSY